MEVGMVAWAREETAGEETAGEETAGEETARRGHTPEAPLPLLQSVLVLGSGCRL
jgi:hypothetical protein